MPLATNRLLHRLLPFLAWRHQLDAATLRTDLMAGVTVALVAIPQALAYAQLAGMPAYVGLYASLLPCIVAALFGSSPQLNTGPVALTSLLTAAALAPLALPGSETWLVLAVQLALLAGLFQLAFGALRLAHFADLLSYPVLHGFINACSVLICLAQLPALLGVAGAGQLPFVEGLVHLARSLPATHLPSLALGAAAIVLLSLLARFAPRWPGMLLVIAGLGTLAWLGGFEADGGRVVGAVGGQPGFERRLIAGSIGPTEGVDQDWCQRVGRAERSARWAQPGDESGRLEALEQRAYRRFELEARQHAAQHVAGPASRQIPHKKNQTGDDQLGPELNRHVDGRCLDLVNRLKLFSHRVSPCGGCGYYASLAQAEAPPNLRPPELLRLPERGQGSTNYRQVTR